MLFLLFHQYPDLKSMSAFENLWDSVVCVELFPHLMHFFFASHFFLFWPLLQFSISSLLVTLLFYFASLLSSFSSF